MNCRYTSLGVTLGVATGNLALGLCVGNAIGDMKKEDFKDTMRDVSSLFKWVKRMFYRFRWAGLPVILFSAMFADAAT